MSTNPLTGHDVPSARHRGQYPIPSAVRAAGGIIFCVQLELGGQTFRVASRTFETSDAVLYESGLSSIQMDRSLDLFNGSIKETEAKAKIELPSVDVQLLWTRGYRLAGARAELSFSLEGNAEASRVVLIDGFVADASWGILGEPIEFTIRRSPGEGARKWPDADAVVAAWTWPTDGAGSLPSGSVGKLYPTIVNRPAYSLDTPAGIYSGSPGINVRHGLAYDLILIAGHAVGPNYGHVTTVTAGLPALGDPSGSYVRLVDLTTFVETDCPVYNIADGSGRICAVVQQIAASTGDGTHEYVIRWYDAAGSGFDGEGMANRTGTVMRSASEIIEWALTEAGYQVDTGMVLSAGRLLDHLQLSGLIEESVDLVEWLGDNVWPLLPVSLEDSGIGVYPLVLDPAKTVREDIELEEGVNCWRTGMQEELEPLNRLSVNYVYDYRGQKHRARHIFDATRLTTDFSFPVATAGQSRDGVYEDTLDSDMLTRGADAGWVAAWKMREGGGPSIIMEYAIDLDHIAIQIGDVIQLTDADMHISGEGLVTGVSYEMDGIDVSIRIGQRASR